MAESSPTRRDRVASVSGVLPVTIEGTLDLGHLTRIDAIRVSFPSRRTRSVIVEGSTDGHHWLTLIDRRGGLIASSTAAAVGTAARFLRVRGDDAESAGIRVWGSHDDATLTDLTPDCIVSASSEHPWFPVRAVSSRPISRCWRPGEDDADPFLLLDLPTSGTPTQLWVSTGHVTAVAEDALRVQTQTIGETRWVDQRAAPSRLTWHRVDLPAGCCAIRISGIEQLCAITVLGAGGDGSADLSHGATVRSTSHSHGHSPAEVLRPGPGSWAPVAEDRDRHLEVDLGRPCTVTEATAAVIATSDDGSAAVRCAVSYSADGIGFTTGIAPHTDVRYVRFALAESGAAISSVRIRGAGAPTRQPWWHSGSPVMRFFPKQYSITLSEITAQLGDLRQRGFRVIEIAGIKKGPPSAFAGLGATDDYALDERIGTMAELHTLIIRAHEYGISVIGFDNLGYAHRTSPLFSAAATRFVADPTADPYPFLLATESRGDRWFRDPDSGAWYYAVWGEDLPTFDWSRSRWREESAQIVKFWLDQGLDGLGIDAPAAYPGADAASERRYISAVLEQAGAWGFAEGIDASNDAGPQRHWQRMIAEQGFRSILDLSISVWHRPEANKLVPAVANQDPGDLETLLAEGRDAVAAVGGTTIEAPAWEADLLAGSPVSAEQRLLEIGCLAMCGSMFYLTCGVHTYRPEVEVIPTWTAEQQRRLDDLLTAVGAEPALGPTGLRLPLPTRAGSQLAWLRTDGSGALGAVVMANFSSRPDDLIVDLSGTGITELGDELTGAEVLTGARLHPESHGAELPTPVSARLTVSLPGRAVAAYEVR